MGAQRLLGSFRVAVALLTLLATDSSAGAASPLLMGFYESWSEPPGQPAEASNLARLPAGIDIIALAFARPDLEFANGTDLSKTGLEVPFDATVLAKAISLYRARSPGSRILLSLGGAVYDRWDRYDPAAAARLTTDLGLDGVDLDYEPADPGCRAADDTIRCDSDMVWRDIIAKTRTHFPRPMLVTAQAWSIGAYGTGRFAEERPVGRHTGSMLWLARDPVSREVDLVAIMAYGAGPRYDPMTAFDAYRAIWPGRLLIGERIGDEGGGGPPASAGALREHAVRAVRDPSAGIMLYTLLPSIGPGAPASPLDGEQATSIVCEAWHRHDCGPAR